MDREALYTALKNADEAGDVESASKLSEYIQNYQDPVAEPEVPKDTFAQHLGKKVTQGSAQVIGGLADLNAFGGRAMRSIYGSLPGLDESISKSAEIGKGMRAMASDRELGVGTDDMRLSKGKRYAGYVASAVPQLLGFAASIPAGITTSIMPSVGDAAENEEAGLSGKAVAANFAVDAAANVVGALIPGGYGMTLASKATTGAVSNVALGAGADYVKNTVTGLENKQLAEKYDPTNLEARIMDIGFGALSGAGHKSNKIDLSADEIIQILDPSVKPKEGGVSAGELRPNPDANAARVLDDQRIDQLATEMSKGLELEPKPQTDTQPIAPKDNGIDFEKVDPNSLKTQQESLDLNDYNSIDYKNHATPEQGGDFIDTLQNDITQPKGDTAQLDLPNINKPLGQSGFGGKQRGSINLTGMRKELPLDEGMPGIDYKPFATPEQQDTPLHMFKAKDGHTYTLHLVEDGYGIEARNSGGEIVGTTLWEADSPTKPADMEVSKPYQRIGINTEIQNFLSKRFPDYDAIKNGMFNAEGQAWADGVTKKRTLGSTRFGGKQGGFITLPGKRELTIEEKAKKMNLANFSNEFIKQYPHYADRPELISEVFSRINDPIKNASSMTQAIESSSFVKGLDRVAGITSTNIGNISLPILHKAISFEKNLLKNTHTNIAKVDTFLSGLNKDVTPKVLALANNFIYNNKTDQFYKLADTINRPDLKQGYKQVREVLDGLGSELVRIGRLKELRPDYFPRVVKDIEGLKNHMGTEVSTRLDKALKEARQEALRTGRTFDIMDESNLVNKFLKNNNHTKSKPGYLKNRTIDELTVDLEKFYATPTEALHTYIRNATNEIEAAEFFGTGAIRDETGRLNVEKSIGAVVQNQRLEGKVTGKQIIELEELLKSRFGPGNMAAGSTQQFIKNIANAGLLGNVVSAMSQGGDLIMSGYLNGMGSTFQALMSKQKVNMRTFGLADHISEEFVGTLKSAKVLNQLFKISQFSRIDELGKNTILNSALISAEKQVKTKSGEANFAKKWEARFGDDYPQLVKDLQDGKVTDLTELLAFSVLSKIQPITKLEMPQAYLDHPQGRILYMLKSFMLKQMDLVRNDAIKKMRTPGEFKEGLSNLMRLTLFYGLSGGTTAAVKDYILNGFENEDSIEDIASDIPINALKTLGFSQYVMDDLKRGAFGSAAGRIVVPPYKMFEEVTTNVVSQFDEDEDNRKYSSLKYLPIVGRIWYNMFTEQGREARQAQLDKDRERAEAD